MVVLVEREVASQVSGMALGQRETKSEALGEVVNLGKELEHEFTVGLRNAFSCILYDEVDGGVGMRDTHLHMLAVGIFGRVIENLTQASHQVEMTGLYAEVIIHVCLQVDIEFWIAF